MAVFPEAQVLAAASVAAAGVGGLCLGAAWARVRAAAEHRRRMRRRLGPTRDGGREDLAGRIVSYAARITRQLEFGTAAPLLRQVRPTRCERWLSAHARKAGVEGAVSPVGFFEAALRLAVGAAVAGALAGAVFSAELSAIGAAAGALGGASAVPRAIERIERERASGLERDLPEMLEVVALGLRSGLSFDRSFGLYGAHFDSEFAGACAQALRAWSSGLATREESLRGLASSYDSVLFARVVEGAVRALRFGSSLAEGFESAAVEARAVHRAHVEERVAKAPVKMMVPTGALILPAMLLLVLGPVLLELMEGF